MDTYFCDSACKPLRPIISRTIQYVVCKFIQTMLQHIFFIVLTEKHERLWIDRFGWYFHYNNWINENCITMTISVVSFLYWLFSDMKKFISVNKLNSILIKCQFLTSEVMKNDFFGWLAAFKDTNEFIIHLCLTETI